MKRKLIFVLFIFFSSILSFGQISKKIPSNNRHQDKELNKIDTLHKIKVKRPGFDLLNTKLNDGNNKGKIEPTGRHWYALERQDDTVYWNSVDCKKVIIELDFGLTLDKKEISAVLLRYNITVIIGKSMFPEIQNFYELSFTGGNRSEIIKLCKELQQVQGIKYLEPSTIYKTQACDPNDTYWVDQWGPKVIYADSVYCYFTGSTKQIVGVIDNAIDWLHQDLYNTVWFGYDFANNDNDPSPDISTNDHGTHVAGTIGAEINNGIGVAGMLNDTVYAAKIGDNTGTLSGTAIINAINAMATNSRIRTFNMSFGSSSPSSAEENALISAWNNGKLPIAAAGNDNVSTPFYPAAYTNVVSVSAVGVNSSGYLIPASYSNYGSTIDVSAPGGEDATGYYIVSTLPNNSYGGSGWQGTSMASPHVTGVAGLIFAINPFLTNTQARTILQTQVFDLGASGYDIYYGSGMVCAICSFLEACNEFSVSITSSGPTALCPGGSVTLSAPYNFNVKYQWKKNGVNIVGQTNNTYTATQVGTYTLYVQSYAGCSNTSNSIIVTTGSSPASNFTYTPSPIYQGQSVHFIDQSTNSPISWAWVFGEGGTSSSQNPYYTYVNAGTYHVTLGAMNACGNTNITKSVIVKNNVGVEDNNNFEELLNIFPNPVNSNFEIKYEKGFQKDAKYQIVEINGKIVQENTLNGQTNEIDISNLSKGIYSVRIFNGNNTCIKKLSKL